MKLKPCKTCTPPGPDDGKFALRRGFTRHRDQICSVCRRYGPPKEPVNYRGRAA